jgi:hypothetical protein
VWRGTVNLGGIKKQIGLHDTRESAIAKYEQIYEHKEFYINKFNKEPKAVISENILRPSEFPQTILFLPAQFVKRHPKKTFSAFDHSTKS